MPIRYFVAGDGKTLSKDFKKQLFAKTVKHSYLTLMIRMLTATAYVNTAALKITYEGNSTFLQTHTHKKYLIGSIRFQK